MDNIIKTLMVCLIVTLGLMMISSAAMAQVGMGFPPLWDFPSFSNQPCSSTMIDIILLSCLQILLIMERKSLRRFDIQISLFL